MSRFFLLCLLNLSSFIGLIPVVGHASPPAVGSADRLDREAHIRSFRDRGCSEKNIKILLYVSSFYSRAEREAEPEQYPDYVIGVNDAEETLNVVIQCKDLSEGECKERQKEFIEIADKNRDLRGIHLRFFEVEKPLGYRKRREVVSNYIKIHTEANARHRQHLLDPSIFPEYIESLGETLPNLWVRIKGVQGNNEEFVKLQEHFMGIVKQRMPGTAVRFFR